MTLEQLKKKLIDSKVPENWYSLDEGLKPDSLIIYKNYSRWEFFYLDEKGDKYDYKVFSDERDACEHLWEKMKYQLSIYKKK